MNLPLPIVEKSPVTDARQALARYTVPNYGRLSLVPARGRGARLYDITGREYLDFGGGVAVCSLGHCPPAITRVLESQGHTLIHCSNWYQIKEQGELGQFLTETVMETPGKSLFCNSGAEANEALLKLARKFGHATPLPDGTPRVEILTFHQSFHGRTYGGISATAQQKVKEGFAPLAPGFTHLPFNDIAALEAAIKPETVAILLEPVQGEGGIHPATPEFLRACARICREKNILLLFDEIQCGLGRTGHWRGWHGIAPEVVPDGVSWAKGLGGGFPIGAAWIRQRPVTDGPNAPDLCDILGPGSHGTTYGGSPLACAVALSVLREIQTQNLCARAAETGRAILETVAGWNHPLLKSARGLGLMLGFELDADAFLKLPGVPEGATPSLFLVNALMEQGLLTVAAGPAVVRWLPPLNVEPEEVRLALSIFRRALDSLISV